MKFKIIAVAIIYCFISNHNIYSQDPDNRIDFEINRLLRTAEEQLAREEQFAWQENPNEIPVRFNPINRGNLQNEQRAEERDPEKERLICLLETAYAETSVVFEGTRYTFPEFEGFFREILTQNNPNDRRIDSALLRNKNITELQNLVNTYQRLRTEYDAGHWSRVGNFLAERFCTIQ